MRADPSETSEMDEPEIVVTWMGGLIPTAVEGTIDGNPFSFSERDGEWDLRIVPAGCDPHLTAAADGSVPDYAVGRMRWEEPRCDGYADAIALIERYARDFARRGWTRRPKKP